MLGLSVQQLLILVGVSAALLVLLLVLRAIFRLTRMLFRLGCLGVALVLVVVYVLMRGLPG